MKLTYYKFNPTGNITLIVETPVPRESQSRIAAQLMELEKDAEQVGFLEPASSECALARLQMMGGEFCGNASICTASLLYGMLYPDSDGEKRICLEVSGVPELVGVSVTADGDGSFIGTVDMPFPEAVYDFTFFDGFDTYTFPLVRFPGIAHAIITKPFSPELARRLIADWCRQAKAEALGLMFFNESARKLDPFVYVASTDTAVWESSCASGTTAAAVWMSRLRRKAVKLSLHEPGGMLTAEAQLVSGEPEYIRMTGKAVLMGKHLRELST